MRLIAVFLAAAVLATPAQSQDTDWERERDRFMRPERPIGSNIPQLPQTADEKESRQMQKRIARCIYTSNRKGIDTLLANSDFHEIEFESTPYKSEEFFDQIGFGRCLTRAMKLSQSKVFATMYYSTLRNLLAEEAYLVANKDAPARHADAPTIISARFTNIDGGPHQKTLANVSDCVTYRNAGASHAFLETKPGTGDEDEAFAALVPSLMNCFGADELPTVNMSLVRMMIADGMWARSHYKAFGPAQTSPADSE